jgi:hypothetical protein
LDTLDHRKREVVRRLHPKANPEFLWTPGVSMSSVRIDSGDQITIDGTTALVECSLETLLIDDGSTPTLGRITILRSERVLRLQKLDGRWIIVDQR